MLSDTTIATVKATVPLLRQAGQAVVARFYELLMREPGVAGLFNHSHQGPDGAQTKALAGAVLAYAENIDNLAALLPAVERIAAKHVSMDVRPEHYAVVGRCLLAALADVAGEAATPAVLAAWGEAYGVLADVFVRREEELYQGRAAAPGGWRGHRAFVVERVVPESAEVASFHLRPADGGPLAPYLPGQYVGVRADIPGHGAVVRNYSLSAAPGGDTYRISVKRHPRGLFSGWLHAAGAGARLELTAPAGDFFLKPDQARPVVLLSGGVGLTPMVAMLESIAATRPGLKAWYVHAARDGLRHAMRDAVRAIEERCPNVTAVTFYEAPRPEDQQGRDYDLPGRVTADWLWRTLPLSGCDVFVCGPRPFMAAVVAGLTARGLPADRLHHEFFGPAEPLEAEVEEQAA